MYTGEPDFTTHDYIIGGKLVVGRATLDDAYSELMRTDFDARDRVKQKLIMDMAQFILENNLVEFTQYEDPISFRKQIAVRAYLAPNEQVKILRLANKVV
jgi:hypothetical protein